MARSLAPQHRLRANAGPGTSYSGDSNTVDVVIRSLRRKLGAVADRIETVRGVGYGLR